MRHTVKVLSFLLISSIVTSLVFAGDKKTEEELLKNKQMNSEQSVMVFEPVEKENVLNIRATSKPYSGFLGTVVTPAQKQYPEGAEGAVLELLDNWDNIPPEDMTVAQEKLITLMSTMSYEELRNLYEYSANPQVENALYQSWFTTQRSGQPGIGLSRSTGAETEPNNNKSSANALSADTTLGYLTAYDEDWYSITVNSGSDWVIKTHASSASDNVGDTKLYLYADTSSTNSIASDVTAGYSTINHRFSSVAALPTNLFFSEYAEGSSNNKYLEIFNGTGTAVDLSDYSISRCSNGCDDTTSTGLYKWDYPSTITFASGTVVADGDVYVVHHGSASSTIAAQGDQTSNYLSNGDDVTALTVAGATDSVFTIIDIIGEMGPDPGSGWDVAGTTNGTKDHTLVRKSSVRSGNTNWSSSAGTNTTDSEWIVEAKDTWTYVGAHSIPNLNQYYVKVTGYSGTYAGAYLLTAAETAFNANNGTVVINEINYNPSTTNDSTEFIELYNSGASAVDMSGWNLLGIISSGSYSSQVPSDYILPSGASIAAGGYYVIARDSASYVRLYGSGANLYWGYGYMPYQYLSGTYTYYDLSDAGETIELKDSTGALVDEVTYDDVSPWPTGADGGGATLELINATTTNNVATSWRGHGGGTPGAANSAQPDLSMGSSITSYQAVLASATATFQLKNNGDADLIVSSVTVDSIYVPGSSVISEGFDGTWSGSPAAPSGWIVVNGDGDSYTWSRSNTYVPEVDGYGAHGMGSQDDWLITPALTLSGSNLIKWWDVVESSTKNNTYDVLVSTTTSDTASFTANLGTYNCTNTALTEHELSLSAYAGSTIYVAFHQTYSAATNYGFAIDDVSVAVVGANVATSWLSATAPNPTTIVAGDSGNISLTFDASSFTSDTSLTQTINVLNNDPQDSAKTFTATMNVRSDTAILDITSTTAWSWGVESIGDTSTTTASITVQNDGGSNLVVDSLRFSVGNNWFSNLTDSTVVEPNATSSFKVYYSPQATGSLRDTLVFSINSDSTSGEKVTLSAYAYNDTIEDHHPGETLTDWTLTSVTKSASGYALMTADGASLISPRVAGTSDSVTINVRNAHPSLTQKFRLYWGTDKDATFPTANTWTLKDSAILSTTNMASGDYFVMNLNVAATDTGYVGIEYDGTPTYVNWLTYYSTYLYDVVVPANVTPLPVVNTGYTLEGFDGTWSGSPAAPSGWIVVNGDGDSYTWSRSNTYVPEVDGYGAHGMGSQNDWLITPKLHNISSVDSLQWWDVVESSSRINTYDVLVSTTTSDTASFRAAAAGATLGTFNCSNTALTKHKLNLSAYDGQNIYVAFHQTYSAATNYGFAIDDALIPTGIPSPVSELSLSASALNFYGVATDTASGTGSHSLTTTVSNSGADTLTGTIAPRSTDFTISPATIDLLPDSSMTLTVTYAPSATGFDSSYVDFTSNSTGVTGTKDSMQVLGYAFEADDYSHFEFADYDSSGFVRQNTAGGTYWTDNTSTSTLGGSNSVMVSSHKYGGESWLITPAYTIDADGERLSWHMKTSDATPTTTSKLYIELLTGNTLADLANAVTLDTFVVSATASDVTEDWVLNFVDAYNLSGTTYHYGFHYVDTSSGASATGAGFYIDNIYFSDAPNVPILTLSSDVLHNGITYLDSGFVRTAVSIGQNTGGDTLLISSVTSDDSDMTVSVVSDTVLPQGTIALNFSVPDSVLVMGKYTTTLTLVHNDTSFSDGSDTYKIKADFTHTLESFESYSVPAGWKTVDADGDENGWTFGSSVMSSHGSRAAYSYKATDQPFSENWLISPLYAVGDSTEKLIFNAHYSSAVDPDYMDVMISKNLGDWVELASVSMMGIVDWERYEYALSAYVGSDVRFAIVDRNYGNETMDRLWVDRFLLPAKTVIKPIRHYRAMDASGSYVWDDSLALVQGVVTVSDQYGGPSYIQDDSAGIAVYANDFSNNVNVGDKVTVRGELTVFSGLLEISYTNMAFFVHDTGNIVAPTETPLEALQDSSVAEAHEGMLLHTRMVTWADTSPAGLDSNWASGGSGFTIKATQGGGQGNTFDVRVDNSTDINQLADAPDGIFGLVGVLGQYHSTDPYGGFQLLPRSVDDIHLHAEYHGTVTNVSTGSALSGVMVTSDLRSDTTGVNGGYVTASNLEGTSLSFSKDGYTPATFSIDASGAGFTMMDVGLYPSPDSVVYINGLEAASDSGYVDTSSSATGTQWAVVRSLQVSMYVSYNNYLDTLINPASGSMMLALNDLVTTNGDTGYVNNSYSIWHAPGVVDLAAFTGVTQKTLSMDLWLDTESGWDYVKAMVKSAADTTDTWMILGSNSGNMGGWGSCKRSSVAGCGRDQHIIGIIFG